MTFHLFPPLSYQCNPLTCMYAKTLIWRRGNSFWTLPSAKMIKDQGINLFPSLPPHVMSLYYNLPASQSMKRGRQGERLSTSAQQRPWARPIDAECSPSSARRSIAAYGVQRKRANMVLHANALSFHPFVLRPCLGSRQGLLPKDRSLLEALEAKSASLSRRLGCFSQPTSLNGG